jgi:hypothetical protein
MSSTRYSLAAQRVAYVVGELDEPHRDAAFRDLLESRHPECLQGAIDLIEEVRTLLADPAWIAALRTMREFRWSSY